MHVIERHKIITKAFKQYIVALKGGDVSTIHECSKILFFELKERFIHLHDFNVEIRDRSKGNNLEYSYAFHEGARQALLVMMHELFDAGLDELRDKE